MAYSTDLANSARRHLEAAEHLYSCGNGPQPRRDVAGYLFGIAAECALKQIMREAGIYPLPLESRRADPFFAHFPDLKSLLRETLTGHRARHLRQYAEDATLMQGWDVKMRYAPSSDIPYRDVDRWRNHAKMLVGRIGA